MVQNYVNFNFKKKMKTQTFSSTKQEATQKKKKKKKSQQRNGKITKLPAWPLLNLSLKSSTFSFTLTVFFDPSTA